MFIFVLLLSLSAAFARELVVYTALIPQTGNIEPHSDIFLMDLATRKPQRLTTSPYFDFEPTLHPSGKLVAFVSDRFKHDTHGDSQIVLKTLPAGKEEHLYIGQGFWAHHPAFSADGKFLYFSRADAPRLPQPMSSYKIVRYNLETKELNEIIPYVRGNFFDIAPSPDGKTLAYRYAADGEAFVQLLDLKTLNTRPLTEVRPDMLDEQRPAWRSADEVSVITEYGEHDELQHALFSVPLATRSGTQILQNPLIYDYQKVCWLTSDRGVMSAADNATGSLQLFLFDGDRMERISGDEVWWSGEPDCRKL